MSMTKEQLKRGFIFEEIGERMSWKDSYHESSSWAFAGVVKNLYCDGCGGLIEPGTLYSIGNRQVYPDAPIYGDWTDKVHWHCDTGYKTEAEVFKYNPPNKIPGWATVSEEEKDRLLAAAGMEITPENKAGVSVFSGVTCVVVGEFSEAKESIAADIEANGGKVLQNVTKSSPVTHVILGADGTTKYGQKTGKGSKRYKDAMKKKPKPVVVDLAWIKEAIKKGENVLASAQPAEKEEKKPAARGRKRKADEKEKEEEGEKGEKEKEEEGEEEEGEGEKKKARTEGGFLYDEESLKGMKRRELQALCKKHGVKANGTNQAMIDELSNVKSE